MANKKDKSVFPTIAGYLRCLDIIATDSSSRTDREWARRERERMVEEGLATRHPIPEKYTTKFGEQFQYIAVRGANWS